MEIIYTSKAKEDLTRIDWRDRTKIISELAEIEDLEENLKSITNSKFLKLELADYVVIGEKEQTQLNILTVQKKVEIKLPD